MSYVQVAIFIVSLRLAENAVQLSKKSTKVARFCSFQSFQVIITQSLRTLIRIVQKATPPKFCITLRAMSFLNASPTNFST